MNKKCLVLDLDNTLWGGTVGEDGLSGIQLSLSGPGAAFLAFQQVVLDLYDRGVILAINSKNNFEEAMRVIRSHPNMILKERHFAAIRINWEDKSDNLKSLAKELNIGLEAMVFLDDEPVNRALVRNILPEVETPELPVDPLDYAKFLISLSLFPSAAITDEDKMRGNLYVTERLRQEAEKSFGRKEEFFKSLGLEFQIFADDSSPVARLAQLTEKTNQFNTHKQPLTEEQILSLVADANYKVFYGRLTDRFGDYGITNLAIMKNKGGRWEIDQFLMSCRVIGRGVEEAFLSALAGWAKQNQVAELAIKFVPTEKNKPAEEFVKKYFSKTAVSVDDLLKSPDWIRIKPL